LIETLRSLAAAAHHSIDPQTAQRDYSLADLDRSMDLAISGQPTYTNRPVTPSIAMQVGAWYACVDVLARDVASAPLLTYRRTDMGRDRASDHYLYRLLRYQANPEMTAWRFKHLMQTWVCNQGNAYAEIEISGRGQVIALWPWRPDRVKIERKVPGGPLVYTYRMQDGREVSVPGAMILHLRGMSLDGVVGMNPIEVHRNTIGLADAMKEHAARFYGNGARPLGVLEHPGKFRDEKAIVNLRKSWQETHGGLENAHRIAILEEGMKYQEVGLNMVDAQYLESQNFSIEDIARLHHVPPHRIGHLARSTNNNIEHQGIEYVQYGIGPWAANWEQEIMFSLLSEREAQTIYCEFLLDSLLRGDAISRSQYIAQRITSGTMTPNEARERENDNRLEGGDELYIQGAMVPLRMAGQQPAAPAGAPARHLNGFPQLPTEIQQ
jgi:HK97 family phage portal protein